MLLLDLVRYKEHLTGTKIGCREGDCGACTVLIGELRGGEVAYQQATSCLTALGNVHGMHVVTIEGVNLEELNFIQQAICEEGGTQCGFCTPGFIVSMTGYCLSNGTPGATGAVAAVDGNICRCTGYKSIERALGRVTALLGAADMSEGLTEDAAGDEMTRDAAWAKMTGDRIKFLIERNVLPAYFNEIPRRLAALALEPNGVLRRGGENGRPRDGGDGRLRGENGEPQGGDEPAQRFLGGGTDLYVQQHEAMVEADIDFLSVRKSLKGIAEEEGRCIIGGAATVTDLLGSPVIRKAFPRFDEYARLISSTPIRNIATVAGNFVNASPIGDLTIFFLALNARLLLSDGALVRELPLREFFNGYKQLNKAPHEFIWKIIFDTPGPDELFHFEKVSKRTCLDIASVNSAMHVRIKGGQIVEGSISAGGVGPVPAWLEGASGVMNGRRVDEALVREVVETAQNEISPISDARGAAVYKRLLLGQLIKAHFLTLFPNLSVTRILEL